MKKQPDPWQIIEALSTTEATRFEWRWRLGAFYPVAEPFLKQVPLPNNIYAPCTKCGVSALLLHDRKLGHYFSLHDDNDSLICPHSDIISTQDAVPLAIHFPLFASTVCMALSLNPPEADDPRIRHSLIGTANSPVPMPVFVLLSADSNTAILRYFSQLSGLVPPALVLSLRPNTRLMSCLTSRDFFVGDLSSLLAWTEVGLVKTNVNFFDRLNVQQSFQYPNVRDTPTSIPHTHKVEGALFEISEKLDRVSATFNEDRDGYAQVKQENHRLRETLSEAAQSADRFLAGLNMRLTTRERALFLELIATKEVGAIRRVYSYAEIGEARGVSKQAIDKSYHVLAKKHPEVADYIESIRNPVKPMNFSEMSPADRRRHGVDSTYDHKVG